MWKNVTSSLLVATGFILVVVSIFGCGRMPPAELWQPNAADSAAIDSIVQANMDLLKTDFAERDSSGIPGFQYLEWVVPDSVLRKAIRDNPFKQRYRCDSMQHLFLGDSIKRIIRFIATVDTAKQETTATVTLSETIPGTLRLHVTKYTRYLKDSIIITPSETLRLPYYDTLFTDTSMTVEKPIHGIATGGCVLRKQAGAWQLWKLAGGIRFYAPTPEDAPYLLAAYLSNGRRIDTVSLRPDTLHFGMQRLYEYPDGLLTYNAGDSLWATSLYTAATDAMNFIFFQGKRSRLAVANKARFTQPGFYRFYVAQIPFSVFYDSGGELNAVVWGIPINVKGGVQ